MTAETLLTVCRKLGLKNLRDIVVVYALHREDGSGDVDTILARVNGLLSRPLTRSTFTDAVISLVAAKVIHRRPDPANLRKIVITLTPKARKALEG